MRFSWLLLVAGASSACGGAAGAADAARNRTFYDWSVAVSGDGATNQYEQPYPPLDLAASPPGLHYTGVTIVRGGVHLSRPKTWMIREASNDPGRAYIQYVSPRAYSFAVYERSDAPTDQWPDVLKRYEKDLKAVGAKATGGRVPVASAIGQGRAYTLERPVKAAKRPFMSRSREIVLRGEGRIVLVQIVHENDDLAPLDDELMRVLTTLEVL
ncbi:MAG TPA: hypothetical protein VI072_03150 [Polyangiaceae bacterium]